MKYEVWESAEGVILVIDKNTRTPYLELSVGDARVLSSALDQSAIHILRDQGHLPQKPQRG